MLAAERLALTLLFCKKVILKALIKIYLVNHARPVDLVPTVS
jgi:hypothetical protein